LIESKDKRALSEIDICDLFITPAIKNAGWDPMRQIRREVTLAPGPVVVRGNMSSRNKKKKKFADYVLSWEPGVPIAIVEAKDNNHIVSHGIQQALAYAKILEVPSAFSSNGDAFASHNKVPALGEDIETEFPLESFPAPQKLWIRYKQFRGISDEEEKLVVQPYYDDPSGKEHATTKSTLLTAPSRLLLVANVVSCLLWPLEQARPTLHSRLSGDYGRRASSSAYSSWPIGTSSSTKRSSMISSPSAR
jgi:type I site-specific restriction endonuclease